MIVKTGANYQAEGGYIEFAKNGDYLIIGENKIPTDISENAVSIKAYMPVKISKSAAVSQSLSLYTYSPRTMVSGETVDVSVFHTITTTQETVILPMGVGNTITAPTGVTPVLLEGSKDVKIAQYGTNYYLLITGDDPIVYMGVAD